MNRQRKLMRSTKHNISSQSNNHHHPPINHESQTQFPQEIPPPQPRRGMPTEPKERKTTSVGFGVIGIVIRVTDRTRKRVRDILVVVLFKEALVGGRVGRGDFIVKETGEDKTDARAACAAYVGEHRV